MFAIITPALITGAFANRVTFKAYMIFLAVWLLVRLLPVRPHGLGRRPARRSGACSTSPAASSCTTSPASPRWPRSSTSARARSPTAARTASRWWRSAPACSGSAGTASTPAASSRSTRITGVAFLNTDIAASFAAVDLAAHGLDLREEAEVPRPADRRGRRAGDDHAGGRLRLDHDRGRSSASPPGVVCYFAVALKNRLRGTTRSTSGASTASAASSGSSSSASSPRKAVNPAGADGLLPGNRVVLLEAGRRGARLLGLGVRVHLRDALAHQPDHAGARRRGGRAAGSTRRLHGESAYGLYLTSAA